MTAVRTVQPRVTDPGTWPLVAVVGLFLLPFIAFLIVTPGPPSDSPTPWRPPTRTTTATTTATTLAVPIAVAAPIPPPPTPMAVVTVDWDRLGDCESGLWDDDAPHGVRPGTVDWTDTHTAIENGRTYFYEGGLHFDRDTWDDNKPAGFPDGAHQATRAQQIVVAEIVLDRQGTRAWPTCWPKVFGGER